MSKFISYINANATKTIISRGKELFKDNHAKIITISKTTALVKVKKSSGTGFYEVEISDIDQLNPDNIGSFCNCPYDDFCKHEVAALLLLNSQINLPADKKEVVTVDNNIQLNGLNKETVVKLPYLSEYGIMGHINTDHYRKIKIIASKASYAIKRGINQDLTATMKNNGEKFSLTIRKEKDTVYSYCSCEDYSANFCEHKAVILLNLLKEDGADAFTLMQDWTERKTKLLAEYGYSLKDDLTGKFKFELEKNDLVLKVANKNIHKIGSNAFFEQLSGLSSGRTKTNYKITNKTATPQNAACYIVHSNSYDSGKVVPFYLTPAVADIGKAGKLSKVRVLEGIPDNYYLTNKVANYTDYLDIFDETDKSLHKLLKNIKQTSVKRYLAEKGINTDTGRYILGNSLQDYQPIDVAYIKEYIYSLLRRFIAQIGEKPLFFNEHSSFNLVKIYPYLQPNFAFTWQDATNDYLFEAKVMTGDEQFKLTNVVFQNDYMVLADAKLYPIRNEKDCQAINFALSYPHIRITEGQKEAFVKNILLPLIKNYQVVTKPLITIFDLNSDEKPSAKLFLEEDGDLLKLTPLFEYQDYQVSVSDTEELIFEENGEFFRIKRNIDFEQEMHELVEKSNENFVEDNGSFYLVSSDVMKNNWMLDSFEIFREKGFEILGFNTLKQFKYNQFKPKFEMKAGSGIDWFDLKIQISFGEQLVNLKDVRKSLLNNEHFVRLGDGTLGILPQEWIEKYATIFKLGSIDKNNIKLSKIHFSLLDTLHAEIDNVKLVKELEDKKEKLLNFDKIKKHKVPKEITATLRDYQVSGYQWLCFLDEFGWGGCLADDMGLGKTLQMLTFLQKQANLYPNKTNLVVVPTSLIFNWANEIQKFAPKLKYLVHYGNNRSKEPEKAFEGYNLVISTYGNILNDVERLQSFNFHYVVLDEAQAIKNVTSQRYKAVLLLKSYNKLVMTGTPIENNVSELFAQMNFSNNGILGSYEFFKSEYGNEIDKYGNEERVRELKKIVYPFILRRTKKQVAKDLPEKTETILYCEMGSKQRKVYDAFKNKYRNMIMGEIDEKGIAGAQMMVLEGLMKLRQICDSPAILNEKEKYPEESVKLEEIMEHVLEVASKHKILIFSQFLGMLDLIKQRLINHKIHYQYLDGQTKDRQETVHQFQENDDVRVFLMSLKAGGVGLNLTAAEYVFLVDPWWNPAVEAQAIDRTHRIGQKNNVFAYKMICKDTIEEKILKLQEKKKTLADDLISTDVNVLKKLTRDDIKDLFS